MPSIDGINFVPGSARISRAFGDGYAIFVGLDAKSEMPLGSRPTVEEAQWFAEQLNRTKNGEKLRTVDVCGGLTAPVLKPGEKSRRRNELMVQKMFPEFVRRK